MKQLVILSVALALAFAAGAQAQVSFKRPDCSAYKAAFKPESKCIREMRKSWQEANFAALQKTGLMFIHMERPDIETSPCRQEDDRETRSKARSRSSFPWRRTGLSTM